MSFGAASGAPLNEHASRFLGFALSARVLLDTSRVAPPPTSVCDSRAIDFRESKPVTRAAKRDSGSEAGDSGSRVPSCRLSQQRCREPPAIPWLERARVHRAGRPRPGLNEAHPVLGLDHSRERPRWGQRSRHGLARQSSLRATSRRSTAPREQKCQRAACPIAAIGSALAMSLISPAHRPPTNPFQRGSREPSGEIISMVRAHYEETVSRNAALPAFAITKVAWLGCVASRIAPARAFSRPLAPRTPVPRVTENA